MQNREAPAYQEYAATILARLEFRQMTLVERGLFVTMRFECWVNHKLPSRPTNLAKILGLADQDVSQALPAVMPFFKLQGDFIVCPELEDYRQHLADRRQKQSAGGVKGANVTNMGRKRTSVDEPTEAGKTTTNPQPTQRGSVESLVQQSTAKQSQTQSLKKGIVDPWVAEYESVEKRAAAYARATGR